MFSGSQVGHWRRPAGVAPDVGFPVTDEKRFSSSEPTIETAARQRVHPILAAGGGRRCVFQHLQRQRLCRVRVKAAARPRRLGGGGSSALHVWGGTPMDVAARGGTTRAAAAGRTPPRPQPCRPTPCGRPWPPPRLIARGGRAGRGREKTLTKKGNNPRGRKNSSM